MKLAICFLEDPKLQVIAFAIFCVVALIMAIEALDENKTKSKGYEGATSTTKTLGSSFGATSTRGGVVTHRTKQSRSGGNTTKER